jgi:integrase
MIAEMQLRNSVVMCNYFGFAFAFSQSLSSLWSWPCAFQPPSEIMVVIDCGGGRQVTMQMNFWAWLTTTATPLDLFRLYQSVTFTVVNGTDAQQVRQRRRRGRKDAGSTSRAFTDPSRSCKSRAIVDPASFDRPLPQGDLEAMARRRFQDPDLELVGNWWQIRVYRDDYFNGRRIRVRKRIRLAAKSMPIREVQKLKAEYLRPLNQGLISEGSATPFESFVRNVYVVTELPLLASTTQPRSQGIIDGYLIPTFGSWCLRDMTELTLQKYILGFPITETVDGEQQNASDRRAAKQLSRESVDKIRDVLSAVLGAAVKYGFLVKNPAEGVRLPPAKRGTRRHKRFIRPKEFAALVELIQEPYATMVFVAVYTGLRISELIALRWSDIHEQSITIDERFCRGDWGAPKSDASNTTIPVNHEVIERIQRLRTLTVDVKAGRATRRYRVVKSDGLDDLVFQSVRSGRPMRDNNILTRHIKPAARKLGTGWVNWLVLRRSYSTWLRMVGTDPRDRQSLMRHSRFTTTAEIYEQDLPESQLRAVEKLSKLVN